MGVRWGEGGGGFCGMKGDSFDYIYIYIAGTPIRRIAAVVKC